MKGCFSKSENNSNIYANQITTFSDQVIVSELQHLQAESIVDPVIQSASNFDVRNPTFYPVQSRCQAIDNFQSLV